MPNIAASKPGRARTASAIELQPLVLSPEWKRRLRSRLSAWYQRNARDLPWRKTRDAYHVWVSEIMLQQTQVATVVSYFPRFVAAFPSVKALAAAPEQEVLRLWEGLGYYRRARQMHRAADIIARSHGGVFPSDPQVVRTLPGIGRYTAGAILSIVYDQRQPILEANSLRLLSRLLAFRGDPRQAHGQQVLWAAAEDILPQRKVGDFNQALMELGSEVCKLRDPLCQGCPIVGLCAAFRAGVQQQIPLHARKPQSTAVREAAVVVYRRGRILLLRRESAGRWAGLWDYPRFPLSESASPASASEIASGVRSLTGLNVEPVRRLTTIKHGVTRFRITLECHEARYRSGALTKQDGLSFRWVRPQELADYPQSVTARRLSALACTRKTPDEASRSY